MITLEEWDEQFTKLVGRPPFPLCAHDLTTTNIPPAIFNPPHYRITCIECHKVMTEDEYNMDRWERKWRIGK